MSSAEVHVSPLESLRDRWDASARVRAEERLGRYAGSLTPAEREAYAASLESGSSARDVRRKLVDRLLCAAVYRRRARTLPAPKIKVAGEPEGPYNDFAALSETVARMSSSHPEWAAEFLDVYGRMERLRAAYGALLPSGKKV